MSALQLRFIVLAFVFAITASWLPLQARPAAAEGPSAAEPEGRTLTEQDLLRPLTEQDLIDRAPRMSLEELAALLEIYTKLHDDKMKAAVAGQILARDPNNAAALEALGKEPGGPETGAEQAREGGEDRMQAEIDALMRECRFGEAAGRLKDLKARLYEGSRFPYQYDLAEALFQRRQLREAERAYEEILRDPGYDPDERGDASLRLGDLDRLVRGSIRATGAWLSDDEGTAYRGFLTVRTPLLEGDWRFGARTRRDRILLDRGEQEIRHPDRTLYETEVFADAYLPGAVLAGVSAGASQSDTLLGAHFDQTLGCDTTWGIQAYLNQHTDDSLQLEALHGTQDRVNIVLETPLADRLQLDASAFARRVAVSADHIGAGYGGDINLGYEVIEAAPRRPSLTISYIGDINIFNHRRFSQSRFQRIAKEGVSQHELLHDLIDSRISRHGPGVSLEGRLARGITYYLSGAALYDFSQSKMQYLGEARISIPLTRIVSLYLGGNYESGGKSGSMSSSVFSAETGLDYLF